MAESFKSFGAKLSRLDAVLTDPAAKTRIAKELAKDGQDDARKAVAADLGGDDMFSGWPKARLSTDVTLPAPGAALIAPKGRSIGPWKVAEFGRHPGMSGPMQGPALGGFTKTGRARKGRAKKWNGTTAPKNTWSDAEAVIERETPRRAQRLVDQALRKSGL